MPPFWGLGYFQSSSAYDTQNDYEVMIDKYLEAEFPLEGVFVDKEYMDRYLNFEVDLKKFSDLKSFNGKLKEANLKAIYVLGAGIGVENNPKWYSPEIEKYGFFIQSSNHRDKFNGNLIG